MLITLSRPYLVDWAWPTLGPRWMDTAYLLIRLVASGYTVKDAERFAAQIPAYADADPAHLDLFAAANVRMWEEIDRQTEDRHVTPWLTAVVNAAHAWAVWRQTWT